MKLNYLGRYDKDVEQYILPHVSGVSHLVQWADIEPLEGQYDFAALDIALAPWIAARKTVNLITWCTPDIVSGPLGNMATPAYIWSLLGEANYTMMCNGQRLPNYLHPFWMSRYKAFLAALARHWRGLTSDASLLGYIRVGLGHGGESIPVPGWDNQQSLCGKAFARMGISLNTWQLYLKTMLEYEASLTDVKWMVGITPGGKPSNVLPDFVAETAAALGIGFGSQGFSANDLRGNCVADWCALFAKYPKVTHELQTLEASCPAGGCATGPLPPLIAFAKQHNASVLEIYAEDWQTAFVPTSSGYTKFGPGYRAALEGALTS